ncbi:MAG: glycosyltransferase family 2 protein [Cyanobium usitatum Tobar12.5m-G36]|nr:glycosyltransferase family 2 protein [Cyanobium usitatum Tobar12.5m-G36]
MKLDWDTLIDINTQNVILHKKNLDCPARVTIGLPTYRRSLLIRRALVSLASQSYRNFVLIISDNNGIDYETISAVKEFADVLPEFLLVAQANNIGALENLKFLLASAKTEYFMWLADDDEISADYIQELIVLLDKDASITTAMGSWIAMVAPCSGQKRQQMRPVERSRLLRLFRFVTGPSDDSAFYGLHRTECLRRTSFSDYLPPNRGVLSNFCYVILFDMLLQGRFEYGRNAEWICHNYSEKDYNSALARGLFDRLRTLLRRVNLYLIYIAHTVLKMPILLLPILLASLLGVGRDIVSASLRLTIRRLGFNNQA